MNIVVKCRSCHRLYPSWNNFLQHGVFKLLRSPGIDSASLCSMIGRYVNHIPTRFLDPVYCSVLKFQHCPNLFQDAHNEPNPGSHPAKEGREFKTSTQMPRIPGKKETFETQWLMDCLLYVYDIFFTLGTCFPWASQSSSRQCGARPWWWGCSCTPWSGTRRWTVSFPPEQNGTHSVRRSSLLTC